MALAALGLSACGKGRKAPPAREAPAPVAVAEERPLDVLDLPAATQVVLSARVPAVASSSLARRLIEGVLAQDAASRARLVALLDRCRIDPARDVDDVMLAMKDPREVALIATGRFDAPALLACVRAEVGELEKLDEPGTPIYRTTRGGESVWLTAGAGTLRAATSRAWLDAIRAPGETLRGRPGLGELLARADRGAAIWGVGLVPPGTGDRMVELTGGKVKRPARAVSFAIHLARTAPPLEASLRFEMADAADAEELARFARGQLDILTIAAQRYGLGRLLARTQVVAEGGGTVVSLRLDDADVRLVDEALASRQPPGEEKEQDR